MRKLEESEEIKNQDIGEHQQCVESQEDCWERMEKAGVILMSDVNDIPWNTSLDLEMFYDLVEQFSNHLKKTTEKGKQRLKFKSAVPIPVWTFIFMTLFDSLQHTICS